MMKHHSKRRLHAIALITIAMIVLWEIGTRGSAAHLANDAPETALRLHSTEPDALLTLAENRLNFLLSQSARDSASAPREIADVNGDVDLKVRSRLREWARPALRSAIANLSSGQTDQRDAMPNSADRFQPSISESQIKWVRERVELALLHDPLNARAFRILGQLADRASDDARASKLMQAAAHRSLSQSIAVYWLMQRSFEEQDYPAALYFADALLRKRPQAMKFAIPILAQIAESGDENARDELKKLVVKNPPWRSAFFSDLPSTISDAHTPLDLFLSIKETPAPPTAANLSRYLNVLVERKLYELAYYTWLQFLPPEKLSSIGLVVNNSFEGDPSGLPFDWIISQGPAVTIDMAARPEQEEKRALLLQFGPGRADFDGVTQLIMLAPGTYQLEGEYQGELKGRRGLQWHMTCAGGGAKLIGESPMFIGSAPTWRKFEFTFTVPVEDCRAQHLRLTLAARSASERLVSGSIWYDELRINRIEQPDQILETEGAAPGNR